MRKVFWGIFPRAPEADGSLEHRLVILDMLNPLAMAYHIRMIIVSHMSLQDIVSAMQVSSFLS